MLTCVFHFSTSGVYLFFNVNTGLEEGLHACVGTQSLPTPCDPMDCSQPGFSIYGIFQTRTLEWVAMSYSRDLPYLRIKFRSFASPALEADPLPLVPPGKPNNNNNTKE